MAYSLWNMTFSSTIHPQDDILPLQDEHFQLLKWRPWGPNTMHQVLSFDGSNSSILLQWQPNSQLMKLCGELIFIIT